MCAAHIQLPLEDTGLVSEQRFPVQEQQNTARKIESHVKKDRASLSRKTVPMRKLYKIRHTIERKTGLREMRETHPYKDSAKRKWKATERYYI